MTSLLELRDKVQRSLAEAVGSLEVRPDGTFTFRNDSARIFVRCAEQPLSDDRSRTLVTITAPLVWNVPATPALYEYVAYNADNWLFGHLSVVDADEGGGVNVFMTHTLLGDYLDAEELRSAAVGIAISADEVDDEIQAKFGGQRFHED